MIHDDDPARIVSQMRGEMVSCTGHSCSTASGRRVQQAAAGVILAAVLPVMVDAAADPHGRRSVAASWTRGAGAIALAALVAWSVRTLEAGQ
jgi:hypothetical protein